MKLKRTLLITTMLIMLLTGCSEATNNDNTDTNFVNIANSRLSYDTNTGIVYHYNSVYGGKVYTIYYSENGKMCKYVDGHIKEFDTYNNDEANSENSGNSENSENSENTENTENSENSENSENEHSVRVYYSIDEKYHTCGSTTSNTSDTYLEHEFDNNGICKYCGYIKEENINN